MTSPVEQLELLQAQLQLLQDSQDSRTMAVTVKFPAFWADKPSVWFGQVEAQFELVGITQDRTKYNHVISILDSRIADEVADIIEQPPDTNRYQYLKTELIKRLSASKKDRIRRLLGEEDIGDRKPSQFLRRLQSLAGSDFRNDEIIRQLWMRRLPANVQAILAAQEDLPLEKAADIADKILEVATPAVHAVTAKSPELIELTNRFEQLMKKVEALTAESQARPRQGHEPVRSRASSRSSTRSSPSTSLCWYHRTYHKKARKCVSPCSWVKQDQGNPKCSQ